MELVIERHIEIIITPTSIEIHIRITLTLYGGDDTL